MNGREIFKSAVRVMEMASRELLKEHGIDPSEVDHYIPHQANVRIVESLANRLEVPLEKFFCNLENMEIHLLLRYLWLWMRPFRVGTFKPGQLGLLVAFEQA